MLKGLTLFKCGESSPINKHISSSTNDDIDEEEEGIESFEPISMESNLTIN